jgi:hypothetical protein
MKHLKLFEQNVESEKSMIKDLFYKYRVDFAHNSRYTDFGIREEDFNELIDEIISIKKIN